MNEMNGYQRAMQMLQEASRPEGERTPERLEENLRWLVRIAMPPTKAPERLRQRIQAIADAHRAWLLEQWTSQEELSRWPGLEGVLEEPEQEILALLLTADLWQVPEDPRLLADARRVMQRILEGLPEPLREVLLLQMVQGLSIREIAHVLGCSEGEASVRLQQVRLSIFRQAQSDFGGTDIH